MTEYEIYYGAGDHVRVRFDTEKNKVTKFVVQYETMIEGKWMPIIRYDTHHGYAHCDEMRSDGTKVKRDLGMKDWNEALTYAIDDINSNWAIYKHLYLKRKK